MKKLIFVLILVTCLFFFVMGCSNLNQSQPSASSSNYYPHADGNRWEYGCGIYTTGEGLIEGASSIKSSYFSGTTTLSNDVIVQNLYSIYNSVSGEGLAIQSIQKFLKPFSLKGYSATSYPPAYILVNNNGAYFYGNELEITTEATLIIPVSLKIGDKWQDSFGFTCEAIGYETVTVPAGAFETIKIKAGEDLYWWYADGAGAVKCLLDNIVVSVPSFESSTNRIISVLVNGYYIEELKSRNF
ncbi:hypothetical protein A2526_05750 [candidate division WOR-1 bacterium RIFOXYD2_FULL_36_8]|uniref:Uncharacterized protein n=1 Tax=candidate division WOR-1 bacterium RIFOXYB2_FULL_36_35 TaxID=1802578 RepID=A0A1F4S6N2_UNCSA|nr:MAG: hypothetical protein A2230_02740 [candidate division WOR-1 bacterium RIFOXYA2_FULL_36_21]OGC16070.1 MAG: hypothetical protein A2290_00070 [candidate division WOR-1 bacterium RIFOXYB2_FULL_36_35]OGC19770.1 MAG: hypothetical protein A2282_00855 [candidate division WOR-1 bacterium RIFOXYA12_FULL_36_13]OGC38439.1 MAG: hypothetical protein A2526_05750 [candidate division WOR-1 bacterium RIFOXYD2_FULL_36_8]